MSLQTVVSGGPAGTSVDELLGNDGHLWRLVGTTTDDPGRRAQLGAARYERVD